MTTASQKLAEYGITMDQAHAWLMANLASPAGILSAATTYGMTNAMLGEIAGWPGTPFAAVDVKAFFVSKGLSSVSLDPPSVVVQSITSGTMTEGNGLIHWVMLESPTTAVTLLPFSIFLGTTNASDFRYAEWSNGVTVQGDSLRIPAFTQSFDFQVASFDDNLDEHTETYTFNLGGVTGTGSIADSDQPTQRLGPSVLLPSYLDGFALVLDFNDRTGELSTESMRAKVMTHLTNPADYWDLFDPLKFKGSFDGIYTKAELGVTHLGDLAATRENIESIFYGTYFDIVQAIDYEEIEAIRTFYTAHTSTIVARSPATMDMYVDLFVEAESDAASPQVFADSHWAAQLKTGLHILATGVSGLSVFELLTMV